MEIRIQSIHFDVAEKLKTFTEKKVNKLEKFYDDILDAEVVLKVTKPEVSNNKEVSVKLNIRNGELFASKVADTFEGAVDLCVEALEKQIIKFKEKIQSR